MRIRILFIKAFLGFSISSYDQQIAQIIDSLENILRINPDDDSNRVNLLIAKGNFFMYTNPVEGLKYTEEALTLSESMKWPYGSARAYRQIGAIQYVLADFPKSIEFGLKALKSAESLNDKRFNAGVYNNLGNVYMEFGEYDKAQANFEKLLIVSRELNMKLEEATALLNIGLLYLKKTELLNSRIFFRQSFAISEENGFYLVSAYATSSLGLSYNRGKVFDSALLYFNMAVAYADKSNNINIKSQSTSGIGEAYIYMNQHNKAEKYALEGLELSKRIGNVIYQKENLQMLSDIYQKQGRFQKALITYKDFVTLRDSVIGDEKKSEIVKKELQFENEKNEAILKAEHTAEIKQQKTVRNFLIGGTGMVVLASGLLLWSYKRRRDAQQKLQEAELKAQVADTEMKVMRLQMNPHFIFNSLNSISDYLAKNNSKEAEEYLGKFAKVMRMTLENSEHKEISLADELAMLELYIQLERKRLNDKFSYEITVDKSVDAENTMVPPMILQPFVENSIWHGLAKKEGKGHISIIIQQRNNMLHCLVEDDGVGLQAATAASLREELVKKSSLATKITKARLELINKIKGTNATVQLMDKPEGNGVKAELELPLEIND